MTAGRSKLLNHKKGNTYFDDIQGTLTLEQMPLSTGDMFYVHSGTGDDGNVGKKAAPMATWDAAHDLASANDVIYLMAGHAEDIAAAAGVVLDTAGVITIGGGNGESRPTITFITDAGADIDIEAAGVGIFGVRFICNITSQVAMLDIDESSARIERCEFLEGTATGLVFIDVNGGTANDCDDTVIRNNFFYAATAGNMNAAIELGEIADSVLIEDNVIVGDFDDAGIHNPTGKTLTNLMIRNNHVSQLLSANHAIELVSACTGFLNDNRLYADAYATTLDPGSLKCSGNLAASAIDEGGIVIPESGDETTRYIGTDSANNDAATTAVVANRDGSVLERQEDILTELDTDGWLGADNNDNAAATTTVVSNRDGSILERLEDLIEELDTSGLIGADDANNAAATTSVVSNRDGSILERLEDLIDELDTSGFIGADDANNAAATTSVVSNRDGSLLERLEAIHAELDTSGLLGADNNNNAAATTSVVSNVDGSVLERMEYIQDQVVGAALNKDSVNYITLSVDLSSGTWQGIAAHEVLEVTGLNRIRMLVEVTETVTDTSGNTSQIILGDEVTTDSLITIHDADDLAIGELWYDATPTLKADVFSSVVLDYISNGLDLGFTISAEATVAGTLVFHFWWEPLNATGACVVGSGGTFA